MKRMDLQQLFRRSAASGGQSLIEVLIGLGISVIMITAATSSLFLVLRSSGTNTQTQIAGGLATALLGNVNGLATSRWRAAYDLNRGETSHYYIATTSGAFAADPGEETLLISDIAFTRYFFIENVSRDPVTQDIEDPYNAANDDPSTLKVTVRITWDLPVNSGKLETVSYLTRWNPESAYQTDWRGGAGENNPITQFGDRYSGATNIDPSTSIRISGL